MIYDLLIHRSWGPWRCREFHKCRRCRRLRHQVAMAFRQALESPSVDRATVAPDCEFLLVETGSMPSTEFTYRVKPERDAFKRHPPVH